MQGEERRVEAAQREYQSLSPGRRSPQLDRKVNAVLGKWEQLWEQSNTYVERYVDNKSTFICTGPNSNPHIFAVSWREKVVKEGGRAQTGRES